MSRDLLLARSGPRLCALPVELVEETMRPLPMETLSGAPDFVRGVAVVRGEATPVLDLRRLLGDSEGHGLPARLVTLRVGGSRHVGLLVDEVTGVVDGETLVMQELPPLLRDAAPELLDTLGQLDGRLLSVLRAGNLLPEEEWARLPGAETPS